MVTVWGGNVPDRGNSKCKGPVAESYLSWLAPPGGHFGLNKMLQRESCKEQNQRGRKG